MKLSTTKFVLLLVPVVCLVSSNVVANPDWEYDCEDDDNDNEDWDKDNNDWEDGDNNDWDEDNNDWDKNNNDLNNNGQDWNSNYNNGQNRNSVSQQSGRITVSTTVWSGSGLPIPTNVNGYYPSGSQPGVVTATWTQVMTTTGLPTNIIIKSESEISNSASVKAFGVPVLLAAIMFSVVIAT